MAITTYAELKTALANFSDRTDLTARMGEFIALFEARANRDLRLPTSESDEALTLSAGGRRVAVPTGFLEPIALWIELDWGRKELTFVPAAMDVREAAGDPQFWTVDAGYIAFDREADAEYSLTLRCLKSFALSDSSTTNWLLANAPDAYLFGALAELWGYLLDEAREAKCRAKCEAAMIEVAHKVHRSRSLAPLRTDLPSREPYWAEDQYGPDH